MTAVKRGIFDDYYDYALQLHRRPYWVGEPPFIDNQTDKPKKRRNSGSSDKLRMQVYGRDKFTCRDCPAVFPHPEPYFGQTIVGLTLGHIIPRSRGGKNTADNLIAQCSRCNTELGSRIWEEGWRSGP